MDLLLTILGGLALLFDSKRKKNNKEIIEMKTVNNVTTFSEQIKNKLLAVGGSITIPLLNGENCHILLNENQTGIISDKLNHYSVEYKLEVFNVIGELLHQKGGRAMKGNGRGKADKIGYGKCGLDTVVGYVGHKYSGKKLGDSTFDPVFVLAAVLDWANLARNCRGYIELV